jgi:RimJ/RimL family protein N-acetyltransferase
VDPNLRDDVVIRPWAEGDLPVLERLLGNPAMMAHLGGPESTEAIRARHQRYLDSDDSTGGLFAVLVGRETVAAGWVGYWESTWRGDDVWECGWHILPEFQGSGVAMAATALMLEQMRTRGRHRFVHAFPSVDNPASSALCRRLGFEPLGEVEVEYPKGTIMRASDWRMDLHGAEAAVPAACTECGAPVPDGDTCHDNFHALLALETGVVGGPGGLAHFYAVASYQLQHPRSMKLTVEALAGLRSAVADALDGTAGIPALRARARDGAKAAGRVTRREGDPVPAWPVTRWSFTVADVLAGGEDDYAARVERWAGSVLRDLEAVGS